MINSHTGHSLGIGANADVAGYAHQHPAPMRDGNEIGTQCLTIRDRLNSLHENIGLLTQRIESICAAPIESNEPDSVDTNCRTSLGAQLHRFGGELEAVNNQLLTLLSRIAL